MEQIKAVFFDIDGTLVPIGAGGVPADTRAAIEAVRSKGVKVFVCTGRHIVWVDNLGDMEFDGYVTVNGGMCLLGDRKTCIYRHNIDPGDIKRLASLSRDCETPVAVVPADGEIFINRIDDNVRRVAGGLNVDHIPEADITTAVGKPVVQLMVFGTESERQRSGIFNHALLHCRDISWSPWFCDVIPADSDKSKGIDRMAAHFGFSPEEAMAFGDGGNDIGMLRHVGIGVAMGNARKAVKEAADYVTTADDAGGIAGAFRHCGLL